jgi:hypothetical protein
VRATALPNSTSISLRRTLEGKTHSNRAFVASGLGRNASGAGDPKFNFRMVVQSHPAHPAQSHPAQSHPAQSHPVQSHLAQSHPGTSTRSAEREGAGGKGGGGGAGVGAGVESHLFKYICCEGPCPGAPTNVAKNIAAGQWQVSFLYCLPVHSLMEVSCLY